MRSSLQAGEALSLRLPALKQPRSVCQLPGRAQIKLSITGRVCGNYMFVNMLEKCAFGSNRVCVKKQFCSEITFQTAGGDPHQITDMRGVLTPPGKNSRDRNQLQWTIMGGA